MSDVCKTCKEAGVPMPCMGCSEFDEVTEKLFHL